VKAKDRLTRAARESDARRFARMQQHGGGNNNNNSNMMKQVRKSPGPSMNGMGGMRMQNAGNMGAASLEMMHIANQSMAHGPSMQQHHQQHHHAGMIMGPDLKKSRAERDVMRVAAGVNGPHPFHNNIMNNNIQSMMNNNNPPGGGYDDMTSHHHLPMAKRQQIAQGMAAVGGMGMHQTATLNANGQPRKNHRRKNAVMSEHPPGVPMGLGHEAMMMEGLKGAAALSQQQQLLHLSQQQQAFAHQFQIKQQQQQLQHHHQQQQQQLQLQQHHHQQQQQQQQNRAKNSHLSISAERRFFEQVKEVLTSISRETWNEFVKCLELFTNDAMSKDDMLDLVGDLFGGPHNDLLHEFKRLLSNREDFETHKSDAWYAVPLSEIDFTQCRKCTPSYRALPKDYPLSKCSERSEEESRHLNDEWVSIPIGSEESYSFKHMRKNQYEEALFKCEDERFEIDMVIDSNMSAIRALEPLCEEIMTLRQLEVSSPSSRGYTGDGGQSSNSHTMGGNLAPRFSFQLEKRHLSTIHLNSIARIYGEHGEEILELLRRNPAGTIPVLLKRLRQKDLEWRKTRSELNVHWKEVQERNYTRSFDHRSFYFRLQVID